MTNQISIQLEAGRDPDGDVYIDIYYDRTNQFSISASEQGCMNWWCMINGVSHHNVVTDALGTIIYRLLNSCLPAEPAVPK